MRVQLPSEAVLSRHPSCARTHSAHTKVQLYRFARRAVLVHTTATSSLMCHVITWSGDVSHRSGKDMRKKDEEWPRTGTFCAAWGRMIAQTLRGYSSKWQIVTNYGSFFRGFHTYITGWIVKGAQKRKTEKSPASSVSPQTGMNFPVVQL